MGGWQDMLQEIGAALDAKRTIYVHDRGLVGLSPETASASQKDIRDERQRTSGSAAGPREGHAEGSGPAGALPLNCSNDLRAYYEEEVARAREAYPSLKQLPDAQGMWLRVESSILEGLSRHAVFLVGLPFIFGAFPKAWAFWASPNGTEWIGPRHTNLPDGSVCAFAPQKGDWRVGEPLVKLLDFYAEWGLRHLYLEVFRRWPGPQDSLHPYYRLKEFNDNELCSCHSGHLYRECCKTSDEARPLQQLMADFLRLIRTGLLREPPTQVVEYMCGRGRLPTLSRLGILEPLPA